MRPRVVLTHWVHPEVIRLLEPSCDVVPNVTRDTLPPDEVVRRCREADAVMVFMPDRIDEAFLAACPRLKVVAAALKGYDNFDVQACSRRNVWFTIAPDLLTVPTAELAVALLLGITRRLREGDAVVRSGGFAGWRPVLYGDGLAGRVAGIVGMGAVGRALARRLAGFDLDLLCTDPSFEATGANAPRRVPLGELFRGSDYILLAAPLTPDTLHLVNRTTLGECKPGSYLVNVGRGSVVDEEAVAEALEGGQLAGYAADVFAMEDWARDDRPSGIPPALLRQSARTLLTPHLGSAVDAARRDIALEAARGILQALAGQRPAGAVLDSPPRDPLPS